MKRLLAQLSLMEDRILDTLGSLLAPFNRKKSGGVTLYMAFDLGLAILISSIIAAGTSAITARQNRKAQKKMAAKQAKQQADESAALLEAEKSSRTPRPQKSAINYSGYPQNAKAQWQFLSHW